MLLLIKFLYIKKDCARLRLVFIFKFDIFQLKVGGGWCSINPFSIHVYMLEKLTFVYRFKIFWFLFPVKIEDLQSEKEFLKLFHKKYSQI